MVNSRWESGVQLVQAVYDTTVGWWLVTGDDVDSWRRAPIREENTDDVVCR